MTLERMSHARQPRGRALIYGHDRELLDSRRLLLEADGYTADTASDSPELEGHLLADTPYEVVVLCHTIDETERGQIRHLLQKRNNAVPVYIMTTQTSPEIFLDEVARLTGNSVVLSKE